MHNLKGKNMKQLTILALLTMLNPCFAKSMKMASFKIPLMVESSTKGIFVELSNEVAKRAGIQLNISLFPPKRTVQNFMEKTVDILFPALDVTTPIQVEKSAPVYIKHDFVFYKKGSKLTTLKDLEGKTVGLTIGYPYAKKLTGNKKIKFHYISSDVKNMSMLSVGRIDAFVVEESSGKKALIESGVNNVGYTSSTPLSKQDVYYAFQKNAQGKDAAAKFSKALADMKLDGTFGKIMSKAK